MPGAAAARAIAAELDTKRTATTRPVNPDRVGEELADDANIWHVYDRVSREDDNRRTKAWDNGLNNLALFAGLFSAVTTAFIIEARHDMEPDYAQLTFLVLNATAAGERFVHPQFVVPPCARTVTCLWVASLVLSLSAALIAIMGKDWIGMYTARPVCNLRQWAEMRAYRLLCVERWYMSGVIAAAPVLLHVSLLLFGAGLVLFISSDPLTHQLTLGLSLAAGVLYLSTTFSAVVFSASPFKSPATQMLRAAVTALFSSLHSVIYRPKRNLAGILLRDLNVMVVGRADYTALLPGCAPENRQPHARWRPAAVLSAAGDSAVAYMLRIPTSVRSARHSLQWAGVRSRLHTVGAAARLLPIKDWFFSSTWTDLPSACRPKLLAEALSWLSGASQAPDIFLSIVFALGDLEVGPQVGLSTSLALRTRLRAEIRRTWQQVDFLTLSRYVLADRNALGDAVLEDYQFVDRFDLSKAPALRCEDGLAAMIKINPAHISCRRLATYFPDQVAQPRMMDFLLPYIQHMDSRYLPQALILVSNRYRTYLWTPGYLNLSNFEALLYQSLDAATREAYATEVTDRYGGCSGAIELLTFLCFNGRLYEVTKTAAVELVMELLGHSRFREHRCLAYLFGSSELWLTAWQDKPWSSFSLWCLSYCLKNSRRSAFQPNSVVTQSGDRRFDIALARVSVMLLSRHDPFGREEECIEFLFSQLCLSQSILGDDGKLDVIRLLLENAALLRVVGKQEYYDNSDTTLSYGVAILAAIIGDLSRRLRESASDHNGERLFGALAFTEATRVNGDTVTWDLGEWIRTQAPAILKESPSSTAPMQGIHDALTAIYPLCETNQELSAHWDRIGYPGRPGDIFSDPFLDVGAFFASAEAPRAHPRDIFNDPWLDLAKFFEVAEAGG